MKAWPLVGDRPGFESWPQHRSLCDLGCLSRLSVSTSSLLKQGAGSHKAWSQGLNENVEEKCQAQQPF